MSEHAQIVERRMWQWWCNVCEQWVAGPRETPDVPGYVISSHLGGHISDGTLPADSPTPIAAIVTSHGESAQGASFECDLCGYAFETAEEKDACEDGHIMAEEEIGVFDGDGSNA